MGTLIRTEASTVAALTEPSQWRGEEEGEGEGEGRRGEEGRREGGEGGERGKRRKTLHNAVHLPVPTISQSLPPSLHSLP